MFSLFYLFNENYGVSIGKRLCNNITRTALRTILVVITRKKTTFLKRALAAARSPDRSQDGAVKHPQTVVKVIGFRSGYRARGNPIHGTIGANAFLPAVMSFVTQPLSFLLPVTLNNLAKRLLSQCVQKWT